MAPAMADRACRRPASESRALLLTVGGKERDRFLVGKAEDVGGREGRVAPDGLLVREDEKVGHVGRAAQKGGRSGSEIKASTSHDGDGQFPVGPVNDGTGLVDDV